jgi:hypothetical protein
MCDHAEHGCRGPSRTGENVAVHAGCVFDSILDGREPRAVAEALLKLLPRAGQRLAQLLHLRPDLGPEEPRNDPNQGDENDDGERYGPFSLQRCRVLDQIAEAAQHGREQDGTEYQQQDVHELPDEECERDRQRDRDHLFC